MSEIAKYHASNPDPRYPGCRNTGQLEDGVVFPGFEPFLGYEGFIGRTSIIEAVGVLYDMTPNEARKLLEGGTKSQKDAVARRDARIKDLEAQLDELRASIARLADPIAGVEIA